MPKKKDSVALFEVISKSRDKKSDTEISVPPWAKPAQGGDQATESREVVEVSEAAGPGEETVMDEATVPDEATESPEQTAEEQESQTTMAPELPSTPPPVTLQTTSTRAPRPMTTSRPIADRPILDTADGRLTVSLNYVSSMVASMGRLLLLIAAFVLGRLTAPAPSVPVEAARWEFGKYYLVIETLEGRTPEALVEAKQIVEFCKANGEPCKVQQLGANYIVWSMTPFDSPNSELANAHALKVQNELGAAYQKKYQTKYRFSQKKNGVFSPEFYPYKKR